MSPTSSPVIVEPGQELCGVPVARVPIPVSIRPDEVRLVASDQVIQLRHRHLLQMRDIDSQDHKMCQEKLWHYIPFFWNVIMQSISGTDYENLILETQNT